MKRNIIIAIILMIGVVAFTRCTETRGWHGNNHGCRATRGMSGY
jgi:hypothetical protein